MTNKHVRPLLLVLWVLLFLPQAIAAGIRTMSGTVQAFDAKTITLRQTSEDLALVPRSYYAGDLREGMNLKLSLTHEHMKSVKTFSKNKK